MLHFFWQAVISSEVSLVSITSLYCQGWYDPKRLETDADWPLEEIQQQEFVESVHAHHRVILLYPNITGIIWGECLKILM